MQTNTYSHRGDQRRMIALLGAATLALAMLAAVNGGLDSRGERTQTQSVDDSVVAAVFIPDLAHGPVPGMPRDTFEQLTAPAAVTIPDLANGPVPGMPQSVWEELRPGGS